MPPDRYAVSVQYAHEGFQFFERCTFATKEEAVTFAKAWQLRNATVHIWYLLDSFRKE